MYILIKNTYLKKTKIIALFTDKICVILALFKSSTKREKFPGSVENDQVRKMCGRRRRRLLPACGPSTDTPGFGSTPDMTIVTSWFPGPLITSPDELAVQ